MLFGTRSLASSAGLDADPNGRALIFGHDGWGTLRLSADPGYELDRVVEALIEFKRKETARMFFNTRAAGVLIGIDQEVVTQRGPFG